MRELVTLRIDGVSITVPQGTTVAAAVMISQKECRTSVTGEPRAPLCGMGICFECRVATDGIPHRRGCQIVCKSGMEVRTA